MERSIVGFRRDDAGTWVADLECLHSQHIHHQPPFRLASWVLDDEARAARVGSPLDCPLCDRAELPGDLTVERTTPVWDEQSVPDALRRAHRVPGGGWGRLSVQEGEVRFRAETDPPIDVVVVPGRPQPIPPGVEHHVEPLGHARFLVELLRREG